MHDVLAGPRCDEFNRNAHAFDAQYLLYEVPEEQWESTVRKLADCIAVQVAEAFEGTKVTVDVEYVYEELSIEHYS